MSVRDYKYRLPEVLEAHRQTANWLVGLSTGALAGLGTFLDKAREPGGIAEWSYAIAALCFVVAVCAGVAFHLRITAYTNCYEQQARAEESIEKDEAGLTAARTANDPQLIATIEARLVKARGERDDFDNNCKRQQKKFKGNYRVLISSFFVAVLPACAYVALTARTGNDHASSDEILLLDGRDQSEGCLKYSALLLDPKTGAVYNLQNDSIAGGTKWVITHAHTRQVSKGDSRVIGLQDTIHHKEPMTASAPTSPEEQSLPVDSAARRRD